jgi:hypothetical protein
MSCVIQWYCTWQNVPVKRQIGIVILFIANNKKRYNFEASVNQILTSSFERPLIFKLSGVYLDVISLSQQLYKCQILAKSILVNFCDGPP